MISTAVDSSAVAKTIGIQTNFKNLRGNRVVFLPQRVAVIGQGNVATPYATTKKEVTTAFEVGQTYGFGSPLYLAARQLLPQNGDGLGTIPLTVYPLAQDGAGVVASGDITPSGTQTEAASYRVSVNGILSEAFLVSAGDSVATIVTAATAAINAVLEMPVVATDDTTKVDLASKWKGTSANDIQVSVVGSTTAGVSFAITQPVGGLTNPSVTPALDQIGDVWETLILNCLDTADTTALTAFSSWGEGRWGAETRKPAVIFTGTTEATLATAYAVPDARKTDRVNAFLSAPGSVSLPFVVAARQLSRIAKVANNLVAMDFSGESVTGIPAGLDSEQWTFSERDTAVKKGLSTTKVRDGVVTLSDTVTFYHPDGDPIPAYRYVCDIVKLQNILFNLSLIFNAPEWDGAPLIPDGQATTNRSAKRPSMAKAAIAGLIDSLALNAVISDPDTAKGTIEAGINEGNPKRLDLAFTVQLSGNINIISIDFNFGFYFG